MQLIVMRCFVVLLVLVCSLSGLEASESYVRLEGAYKFHAGDSPDWSLPSYDDSNWGPVNVPASWQSQKISPEHGMGWYRLDFEVPAGHMRNNVAILMGRIGDADEVFLNGVRLGGEGVIGDRLVEAVKVERLYKIPGGIPRHNDRNLLAVRVMNVYTRGGLFDRGVVLGDYNDLLNIKKERETPRKNVEIVFFTFFALFLPVYGFLYLRGIREHGYTSFGLLVSLFVVVYILDSIHFYETGLKDHTVDKIILSLTSLVPANLLLFVAYACRYPLNRALKLLLLCGTVLSACFMFASGYEALKLLENAWVMFVLMSVGFAGYISIRAYKLGVGETGFILAGIVGLCVGALAEVTEVTGITRSGDFFGAQAEIFSVPFMMVCIMYAMGSRFVRMQEDVRALSGRILTANEEERKRLARDLHDGIGQSLLAIKLRLQMIAAKAVGDRSTENGDLREVISELTGSISELRDVAQGLRPSFLENMDVAEAIRWYGKSVEEKTGMKIAVEADAPADEPIEISPAIKDNIYRMFQEALNNVLKHSGADLVKVTIKKSKKAMLLGISDNGKGFDVESRGSKGIGLSTMRERAELLGGSFSIQSSEKIGTAISVEVPLR